MHVDGIVILLATDRQRGLPASASALDAALRTLQVELDPWQHSCDEGASGSCSRCVPRYVKEARKAARIREAETRFLDIFMPSRRYAAWEPVAAWLCEVGRTLAVAEGPWRQVVTTLPGGVIARTSTGVAFAFALWAEAEGGPVVCLVFDWRSFNRCPSGPDEVSRVVATIGAGLGSPAAAGGPPEIWRNGVRQCLARPAKHGALFAGASKSIATFGQHSSAVGGFKAAWRASPIPSLGPPEEPSRPEHENSSFAPAWTGCSARFAPRNDGLNDADLHYEKHVHRQGEWTVEELPDVTAYTKAAARTLDALDDVVEMWQPTNRSIIKYDAGTDVLAIGEIHSGDLRTFFRPGGARYALRKLESGQWIPPPVLGVVDHEAVRDDEELAALFGELERAVAVADANSRATIAGDSQLSLATVASCERCEFLLYRVKQQYLASADEVRLDADELALAAVRGAVDVALEVGGGCLIEAIQTATELYISEAVVLVDGSAQDSLDELLDLRDTIEFARMASRAHGRVARLIPRGTFRDVELLSTDAFVAITREPTDPAPPGGWPDTFVWRTRQRA